MNQDLIGQVKECAADPTKAPYLHDLLNAEARRVIEGMRDTSFGAGVPYSKDELARRVAAYESLTEDLGRAAALVAYWNTSSDDRLVPGIVARLANAMERANGVTPWLELYLYPALLVLYAGGLGCVVGHREEQLAELLASSRVREGEEWRPNAAVLNAHGALDPRIAKDLPGLERHHTPMSDHLAEVLRPWLEDVEPDPVAFEHAFDRFEYLHGLVMSDLTRQGDTYGWAPVGRFSWRGERHAPVDRELEAEIASSGLRWPLLEAGLFGHDLERLKDAVKVWSDRISQVRRHQF